MDQDNSKKQPSDPFKKATTPSKKSSQSKQGIGSVKSTVRSSDDPRSPGAAASPSSKQASPSNIPLPGSGQRNSSSASSSKAPTTGSPTLKSGHAIDEDYDMIEDSEDVPSDTGTSQETGNIAKPLAPVKQKTSSHSRDSSSGSSFVNVTESGATSPYEEDFDLDGHDANQGKGINKALGRPKPGDSDEEW